MMPVDMLVKVLDGLYNAFQAQRQLVFEVTGLADIMRGQTDPNETLGAQQLKSKWGSLRLQRIQRGVQKFIRDALRLQAEIIGNRFQPETLQAMIGMPVSPQAMQVLRSPAMRQFRVDIETDSTIAETVQADMQEMSGMMQSLGSWLQVAPMAVQGGVMSMDAVRTISMAILRRAKMGSVVESSIEESEMMAQQQQPPQQPAISPEEEAALMQSLQELIGKIQQMSQSLDAERVQSIGQVVQEIRGIMAELQQTLALPAQQIAAQASQAQATQPEPAAAQAPVDDGRELMMQAMAQMSEAIAALSAPRVTKLVSDETGRPVGAVSTIHQQSNEVN
jgi:hypothetical protein